MYCGIIPNKTYQTGSGNTKPSNVRSLHTGENWPERQSEKLEVSSAVMDRVSFYRGKSVVWVVIVCRSKLFPVP